MHTKSTESWTVSVHGTRGAVPMADAAYLEYGGNTSCVSVRCGSELVVFDAGSGITRLDPGPERIHILISHLHLDHIQGLAGFRSLNESAADIHFYGEGLREKLGRVISPPYWPLGLEDCRARLSFHEIGPDERIFLSEALSLRTLRSRHPNESLIYRLDGQGGSVVYTLDCELDDGFAPELAAFAEKCSLLIWDANYTAADLRRGWGHSTWEQGLDIARAAGADRVLMTHYDRSYTDEFLRRQERLAKERSETCIFAREGMEIRL